MLVITRRVGEIFVIGEDAEIKVQLISMKGNQVRIGIDAPKHIPIVREEILGKFFKNKGDNP